MAIRRFVEAAKKRAGTPYRGADRIPGTDKVRTYAGAMGWLYSKESDLDRIIRRRERVVGTENKNHKNI